MNGLKEMLEKLETAAETERAAKAEREAVEAAIAEAVAAEMPAGGGSKSFEREGFKFEVKTGFRFQADIEEIEKTEHAATVVKTEKRFSDSAYRKLWEFNRAAAEAVARFVTVSPAKPSVRIKGKVPG